MVCIDLQHAQYSYSRSSFQRPTAEAAGDSETLEEMLIRLAAIGDNNHKSLF